MNQGDIVQLISQDNAWGYNWCDSMPIGSLYEVKRTINDTSVVVGSIIPRLYPDSFEPNQMNLMIDKKHLRKL